DEGAELAVGVGGGGSVPDRAVAKLIGAVYRQRIRGVGHASALRAIRYPALVALGMRDKGGGWDVEMLGRALKLGLDDAVRPATAASAPRRSLAAGAAAKGRSLFHILRHATLR